MNRFIFFVILVFTCLLVTPSIVEADIVKIAHAGGSIDKVCYSNSKEALTATLKSGCKLVELDFNFTTDNVLVCTHKWEGFKGKAVSKKKFLKKKFKGKYTLITARSAIKLCNKYRAKIIVDTKSPNIKSVHKKLLQICNSVNKKYWKKLIPQLYSMGDYKTLHKLKHFKEYIYSVYKDIPKSTKSLKKICKFCSKNGIYIVTIPWEDLDEDWVEIIQDYDLDSYTHTIDDPIDLEFAESIGVVGIYTNFLM